ncbi:hypothetical protein FXO38_13642 [Capsicum annuum]|nr:hypothetical protein FXO38_13642 [Capsicum annuum]KAF3660136.1 hypothetical protein FXO37_13644 [Capsicum annuum]
MDVKEAKTCCVVLVPSPFQGHVTPMLQLAYVLRAKGFSIVISHSEVNPPDNSKHPEFVFLKLKDGLSNHDASLLNLFDIIPEMNANYKVLFRDYVMEIMEKPELYGQISCIVYDHLMYFTTEVADQLKHPTILLRPSSYGHLEAACAFFQLKKEIIFPCQRLSCWIQCPKYLPSGPLHKISSSSLTSIAEEDASCISWIDTQAPNSVLYVSLRSLVVMDKNEFIETAWGLFNSNQPFLWVVRKSIEYHDLTDEYLEAVGDRGRIVKWAPQKEVLAHPAVGGFWSHCGCNSTLESIFEGIPMICRPGFGDQNMSTRYFTHVWKVGIELEPEDFTRLVIESTIRKLMVEEEGKELRQRVLDMKQELEISFREGGSWHNSLKSLMQFISSL